MPFLDFGDDEEEVELKFDDCATCKFLTKLKICGQCDSGEFFEELDPEGIDALFRD